MNHQTAHNPKRATAPLIRNRLFVAVSLYAAGVVGILMINLAFFCYVEGSITGEQLLLTAYAGPLFAILKLFRIDRDRFRAWLICCAWILGISLTSFPVAIVVTESAIFIPAFVALIGAFWSLVLVAAWQLNYFMESRTESTLTGMQTIAARSHNHD